MFLSGYAAGTRTFKRRQEIQRRKEAAMADPWSFEEKGRKGNRVKWDSGERALFCGHCSRRRAPLTQYRWASARAIHERLFFPFPAAPMLGDQSTRVSARRIAKEQGDKQARIKMANAIQARLAMKVGALDELDEMRDLHVRLKSSFGAKALRAHLAKEGQRLPYFLRMTNPTDGELVRGIYNDTGMDPDLVGIAEKTALMYSDEVLQRAFLGQIHDMT